MGTFEAIDGVMERLEKYLPWFVRLFSIAKEAKPRASRAALVQEVDDHITPGKPDSPALAAAGIPPNLGADTASHV